MLDISLREMATEVHGKLGKRTRKKAFKNAVVFGSLEVNEVTPRLSAATKAPKMK